MASQTVNIRRNVDDKFYRYRMPLLLTKIEGKGNGIKTVLPNVSDVARALSRPPTYPTKYFGCELGAQTSFDEKADRYIVNGAHDANKLRELLDGFIDRFVLCKDCKNPETDLIIIKGDKIVRDCKACGKRTEVDMRHKLTTFILKNSPDASKKGKKAKDGKKTDKTDAAPDSPAAENGDVAADGDEDELTRRIKSEAAELADAPKLVSKDNDWALDTSTEAVRARTEAMASSMKAGILNEEDSDEDGSSPYAALGQWAKGQRLSVTAVDVFKHAAELGIEKKHKTVQVLVQALFTENIMQELPKFMPLFKKLTTSEKHQKALLGGLERFVGIGHLDLIPAIPKLLMSFYQADVLEEDVVKQWGTHVSKKYVDKDISKKVRKSSEPFLKWLDEADEDDGSGSEEEDEE